MVHGIHMVFPLVHTFYHKKKGLSSSVALIACLNKITGLLTFFIFKFGYAAFLDDEFSMAVGKTQTPCISKIPDKAIPMNCSSVIVLMHSPIS